MASDPTRAFGFFSLSVDFCCGLFSVTERLKRALPDEGEGFVPEPGLLWLSLKAPPPVPATFFWKEKPVLTYRGGGKRFDINEDEAVVLESPIDLFTLNNTLAEKDHSLYEADPFLNVLPEGVHFRGNRKDLLIHKTARILPQIAVSTENGPVVIDQEAVIAPFSVLEGPLYVGKGAHIDGAKLTGGTYIGEQCRIGGEVEASVFHPFSNKHHEGFIGHSVIGRWVNLGALTTGSDLKNNYSPVHFPDAQGERKATPLLKLGALIGDHVKTGIGTLLNTGSRISLGSLIAGGGMAPTWLPPFSWHVDGKTRLYEIRSFIHTEKIVMGRRNQEMNEDYEQKMRALFNDSKGFHEKGEGK
ncbi:MAG TPA: hypothetical protein ENN72_02725 [Firmicutes bacterium]|nr:hypothetical protein [Bacillota bacterium]